MSDKILSKWYARNIIDYRRKTSHLSLIEHGVYTILLDHYYDTGEPLPANEVHLQRICRAIAPQEVEALRTIISQFFELLDGCYHNKTADEELVKRKIISENKRRDKKAAANGGSNEPQMQPICTPGAPPNADTDTYTDTLKKERECAPEEIKKAFDDWNEIARSCGLPEARELNKTRKQKIRDRIASGKWPECLQIIRESKFLQGEKGFRATLDWILEPSHFTKIVEGNYSEKAENAPQQPIEITTPPEILKLLAKRKDVFTPAIIHHWIDPCTIEMNGETTIRAPNKFHSDWLNSHYLEPLGDCFDKLKIEERNAA